MASPDSAMAEAPSQTWIALLGRQDKPTDGVEDYCVFLGRALAERRIELERVRMPWFEKGWVSALQELRRECRAWNGKWVLLQYTALAWSRRGFPFPALAVLAILRRRGARCAILFHEAYRQREDCPRWINRIRGSCQDWVIRTLYRKSAKSIFTVPLGTVSWLPAAAAKASFIPIGANIPQRVVRRAAPPDTGQEKTVIVFGVTGAPATDREVEEIAAVIKETSKVIAKLRLVVVGRGAAEAREQLAIALKGVTVGLVVRGLLPAEEIACELQRADVQLFVRGAITLQRGSVIAGIACGIPIVGYRNGDIRGPLREAGVESSPWRDRDGLVRGLVHVLSDPQHWTELRERNLRLHENHFSWERIADRYTRVLTE